MKPKTVLPGLAPAALFVLYPLVLASPLALAALSDLPPINPWLEAAAATGLVGAVGLAVQFLTSGRFEALSGRIGIDVTMAFHKWSARMVLMVVILHPVAFAFPMALRDPAGAITRVATMFAMPNLLSGVLGFAALGLLIALALMRDRLHYEFWRALHGVLAASVIALVVHHILDMGTYSAFIELRVFWVVIGGLIIFNVIYIYGFRTYKLRQNQWRVESVRSLGRRLWEVILKPVNQHIFPHHAGQFIWLTVQPRLFPVFDHPFSIASSPQASTELTLIIKESGDFTQNIGHVPPGTLVGLDGPYGSFVLPEDEQVERLLFIAGGVGIAPILGLLRDLTLSGETRPVSLVYASKRPDSMIEPREIMEEVSGLDIAFTFLVESAADGWPYETGRIDQARLKTAFGQSQPDSVAVLVCGPGGMIASITDMLNDLGVPLASIHYERFDYADGVQSRRDRRLNLIFWSMGGLIISAMAVFSLRPF